jgi:hypothetical protein
VIFLDAITSTEQSLLQIQPWRFIELIKMGRCGCGGAVAGVALLYWMNRPSSATFIDPSHSTFPSGLGSGTTALPLRRVI